jgi:hypothetical protein
MFDDAYPACIKRGDCESRRYSLKIYITSNHNFVKFNPTEDIPQETLSLKMKYFIFVAILVGVACALPHSREANSAESSSSEEDVPLLPFPGKNNPLLRNVGQKIAFL